MAFIEMPSYMMRLPLTTRHYAIIYDAKASDVMAVRGPALPPQPNSQEPHVGSGVPHDGRGSRGHVEAHPLAREQRRRDLLTLRLAHGLRLPRPSGAPRWRCKDCKKDFSI